MARLLRSLVHTRRHLAVAAAVLLAGAALWTAGSAQAATTTFLPTGAEQTYTVPAGVTSVNVVAIGGKGASRSETGIGGFGAMATANLAVTPGQVLYVEVGGNGSGSTGGFNGGADGGVGVTNGGGGGGASDVRTASRAAGTSLALRLIVAAGGGGSGAGTPSPPATNVGGTAGPNPTAGTGYSPGGQPGTATAGGAGGSGCETGASGVLGSGGVGGKETCGFGHGGGGGGGGVYGGGGGGSTSASSGGGAGWSGFGPGVTNTSIATDVTGAPSISITPAPPGPAPVVDPPIAPPIAAAPTCRVPKLGGRKLKGARNAVRGKECKLGKVRGAKGKKAAKVVGQNPKPGVLVPVGTAVNVTLAVPRG